MNKIKTACIIDDDRTFIFGTKKIMQMENFCDSFLVYNDGHKALLGLTEIIKSGIGVPEVILLDLNMPVIDGWEFLENFVTIPNDNNIKIFIVSSSIDPLDIEKAINYQNVTNYIIKPITKELLAEMAAQITTA